MHAVQATAFGEPSVLTVVELPDPVPGPGQVAIDVTHAAVGLIDLYFRQGVYRDVPGMAQPPFVPGLEVAGTVHRGGPSAGGRTRAGARRARRFRRRSPGHREAARRGSGGGHRPARQARRGAADAAAVRPDRRLHSADHRAGRGEVRRGG
ncbi:alcohol dehydrogenase catalytic domain-containing protein [Skermania piniformis]|uniref:alcohol dehydrogenase catalytic domain-containing protein n=1 Tax=Skermania pinensis TaxID=39122 RepID=UPI000A89699F